MFTKQSNNLSSDYSVVHSKADKALTYMDVFTCDDTFDFGSLSYLLTGWNGSGDGLGMCIFMYMACYGMDSVLTYLCCILYLLIF